VYQCKWSTEHEKCFVVCIEQLMKPKILQLIGEAG
jgi:hypothetical protein